MQKFIFKGILILLITGWYCANGQGADFSFKVVNGASGKVKLIGVLGNQNLLFDSTYTDADGKAVFKKDTLFQAGFYYIVFSDNSILYALLDKDQTFSLTTNAVNMVDDAKIEGSQDNDLYYQNMRFEKMWKPRYDSVVTLMKAEFFGTGEYDRLEKVKGIIEAEKDEHINDFVRNYPNSFFTKFKTQGQNPKWLDLRKPNGELDTLRRFFTFRAEYWKNYDFSDPRLLHTPVYYNKLNNYLSSYIPQNPDSLVWAIDQIMTGIGNQEEYYRFTVNWIALNYKNGTQMDWEKIYSHVIMKYLTYELAKFADSNGIKRTRDEAAKMTESLMGMKGQDVCAKNENDSLKCIYSLKSEFIVVFIFSPDCEHCQKEAPELVAFYNEWKNKGVDIFGISLEQKDKNKWVAFNHKYGLPFTVVWDPGFVALRYKYYVDITPEIYLLNKDRIIVGKNLHVNQIAEMIEKEKAK